MFNKGMFGQVFFLIKPPERLSSGRNERMPSGIDRQLLKKEALGSNQDKWLYLPEEGSTFLSPCLLSGLVGDDHSSQEKERKPGLNHRKKERSIRSTAAGDLAGKRHLQETFIPSLLLPLFLEGFQRLSHDQE